MVNKYMGKIFHRNGLPMRISLASIVLYIRYLRATNSIAQYSSIPEDTPQKNLSLSKNQVNQRFLDFLSLEQVQKNIDQKWRSTKQDLKHLISIKELRSFRIPKHYSINNNQ